MDACILSSCVHTPILCFLQIAPPLKNLSVIVTVQGKRLRRCTLLNARIIDDLEDTDAALYRSAAGAAPALPAASQSAHCARLCRKHPLRRTDRSGERRLLQLEQRMHVANCTDNCRRRRSDLGENGGSQTHNQPCATHSSVRVEERRGDLRRLCRNRDCAEPAGLDAQCHRPER